MKKPLGFGATMLASALGVLIVSAVGALLMFIFTLALIAGIGSMSRDVPEPIKKGSVLTVNLGSISGDRTASKLQQAFGDSRTVGLVDVERALLAAATDPAIEALYLNDDGCTLSWGSLTELREALQVFAASDKPVVAYATSYTQGGYYLCSDAERVCLHPAGMVDFRGIGAEVMFYKDLLDRLGIEMQLIRPESCAYKSAGEAYTMDHMSPANREQIRAYIGSIWHTVSGQIAASRGMSVQEVNTIADNLSGYMATDAYSRGLVDILGFEADVRQMLKDELGGQRLVGVDRYAKNLRAKASADRTTTDAIALIYAEGNVVDGTGRGTNTAVYGDDIVKALQQAADNEQVKAIVLRVNSPGGQATASESMTHAVEQARAKKPVVVSMGDLAASAGYEMSCLADVIVAQPTTITGSIGVFATLPNAGRLMRQKLGLATDTVKTNRNAADLTVTRPLSPTALQLLNRNVEDFYRTFVSRVVQGRRMSLDSVQAIARGRVWTGADAVGIGLVDTLGGLPLAMAIAAEWGGVERYRVVEYPKEKDLWTQLSELMGDNTDTDLNLLAKARLAWQWRNHRPTALGTTMTAAERDLRYLGESGGLQARLPFLIVND